MKWLIFWASLSLQLTAYAQDTQIKGCQPITLNQTNITFANAKPRLLLIHNASIHEIWLTHTSQHSMSAGFSQKLGAHRWSALMLTPKQFNLECVEATKGHEHHVPCSEVVSVCQLPTAHIPVAKQATFWLAENVSKDTLMTKITAQNITIAGHETK